MLSKLLKKILEIRKLSFENKKLKEQVEKLKRVNKEQRQLLNTMAEGLKTKHKLNQ